MKPVWNHDPRLPRWIRWGGLPVDKQWAPGPRQATCQIPRCRRKVNGARLCLAHYKAAQRGETTFHAMPANVEERFSRQVDADPDGGCWLWAGTVDGGGYGQFSVDGVRVGAHRWAWERHYGQDVPDGLQVDHRCQNRACVNPKHLQPVSPAVNTRRGQAGAHNAGKSHCPRGHEYVQAETYIDPRGSRNCRACRRERAVERRPSPAAARFAGT